MIKVWSKEAPAMMMSNIPVPLDTMNLLANVGTKAELEQLSGDLQKLQDQAPRGREV